MASDNAYGRASRQAYDDFTSLGRDAARANPLTASMGALTREGIDNGFSSGWMGRVAHDAENTMETGFEGLKGRSKGLYDVGKGAVEKGMKVTDTAIGEGVKEYRRMESGGSFSLSPEFDKFNAGFVGRNFPEISEMFGTAEIKAKLAENQIEAAESALVHSGKTFDELRGLGLTRQQVLQEAQNRTQDPKELELVNAELDRVYGKLDESGYVKPDKNITDVSDKVTTARQGGDPTANKVPEEVVKKAQFDEGDIYAKAIDKTANDFHAKHITPQNWYESRSFNMGLMRFGLGLLSGEDYATAFSNAAQDYTKLSDREKREAYADELISSGYTQASVMQWIDEGKANLLAKPEKEEKWETVTDKATGTKYQKSSLTDKLVKLEDAPDRYTTYRDAESGSLFKKEVNTGNTFLLESAYGRDDDGNLITNKGKGSKAGEIDPTKNPMRANAQVYAGAKAMEAAMTNWNRMVQDTTGGDMSKYGATTVMGQVSQVLGTGTNLGRAVNLNDNVRKTREAEEGFLQAYGRVLSGGAIKDEEWYSWGNTFFPRSNDTPRDLLRKQFMRDNMGLLIGNMYYQSGMDPRSMTKEQLATLPADAALAIQAEAGAIFKDVVDFIPQSGNRPAAYVLADGNFWIPNQGIVSGGS